MELKKKTKTVHIVDYSDLESFIESIYGGNYEFVAEEEANNYSSYETSAPNKGMMWDDTEEKIKQGNYNGISVHQLFNQLHKDGHVEKGDYLINVCW